MRLLSGSTRLCFLIVLFMLATMLPASWSSSGSYEGPGATSAWAGSPDETLNPPPEPPKKGTTPGTPGTYDGTATTDATASSLESARIRTGWSWTEGFGFAWRYYLSQVLRF